MKLVCKSIGTCIGAALALGAQGCGWIPGEGFFSDPNAQGVTAEELPDASNFKCSDAGGDPLFCADFNDGETRGFDWEGGDWEVIDGRLVGYGPDAPPGNCADHLMTHAVLTDVQPQDVHVSLEMAAMERVDKVVLLRSANTANRMQLNFRALTRDGDYGDLMVQETRNCAFTILTQPGEIPIGHDMGEKIDVDIWLTGTRLRVEIDGNQVVDRDFDIVVQSGSVGLGVIDHAASMFDDVVVENP